MPVLKIKQSNEIFAVLGSCIPFIGSWLLMLQDSRSVPSLRDMQFKSCDL